MADPRFFRRAGPFSAGELATQIGAELCPADAADRMFADTGPLSEADSETLSFLDNKKYLHQLAGTRAGGVVIHPDYADRAPDGAVLFLTTLPYRAFALAAQRFYPETPVEPGIHPSAVIAEGATIGEGARIDAGAVIDAGVEIGAGCWIGANVVIEAGCAIGAETRIGAGCTLSYCVVGRHCMFHQGVRIGQRGFGFAMDERGHIDLPQTGRVIIGDGVEIGANSCIDRGMSTDTVIGAGCKIDNLVQIGHNVRIGKGCVLVGQCGIAGSAVLEDYVVAAAQSGIAGHITVGKGAQIAAKAGAIRDIPPGAKMGGVPAVPIRQWHRHQATLNRLSERSHGNNGDR